MNCFAEGAGVVTQPAGSEQTTAPAAQDVAPAADGKPNATIPPNTTASAPSDSTTSGAPEKTERIEVTGSHIRRVDVEGPSPVVTITRKEIEKTGYNSVGDVVRDSTANSFGSLREKSGSNAAGNAEVSLRGLGSDNTLVLLNGQRLPSDAVTGAVDLNLIPIAAVERVEILKDGASAIYGSDALGGVVNIITRKEFSGTEADVTQTIPQHKGGAKTQISAVNGVNAEGLNIVNVLQYRYNSTIYSRDRDWTNNGYSNIGNPGSYRSVAPDGTATNWNADPNCPPGLLKHTPGGDYCTFKYSDYSTELPGLQQISALSELNYEASSSVKIKARLNATQRTVNWSFAPAPGDFTIPGGVAGGLGAGGAALPGTVPGQDVEASYRLTELGTRDSHNVAYGYGALLGTTIQLPHDWALDITASHNGSIASDKGENGYALTDRLTALIASGAYNPFAAPGAKGDISSARYTPEEKTLSQLSSAEAKISGELGQWNEQPIGLAVGTTITAQRYIDNFDAESVSGNVFGNAGSSGGGARTTEAVFSELSLPVLPKVELQLAGRYDNYSDFGDTINPKAAVVYHIMPELLLRGSVGTGFRAPLMQQLYAASSNGYQTFVDEVSCSREKAAGGTTPSCSPQQYLVTSSGNPGLKQETSVSYNVGAVADPVRDVSVGVDWYLTKVSNVVDINYQDLTTAELNGANLASHGVTVNRPNGELDGIVAPLQNLATRQISGLDITGSYRFGRFRLATDQAQIFYFREEGFPGAGLTDKLDDYAHPRWRNTTDLTYTPGLRHTITLTGMTIAGHAKQNTAAGNLSTYTTFDTQYEYNAHQYGTVILGIRNLLGSTPPLDESNTTAQLDTTLYDQIGRQFLIGYKKSF